MPRKAPPPVASISWATVLSFRMARQHLAGSAPALLDIARDLFGVHAQVMSSAELTFGVRTQGLRRKDVADALWSHKSLVKTWAMRGTLHLVTAADLPLHAAASGLRRHWLQPAWLRAFGVTQAEMLALVEAVPAVLDGRCLTRQQLTDELVRETGSEHMRELLGQGWGMLLKPAAFAGLLCFGPNEGRNVTFVRPDQWIGPWDLLDADEAMDEIVRRYLRVYGPANRDDLGRWWGATPAFARQRLLRLSDELVDVDIEGRRASLLAADLEELVTASRPRGVRLLAGFDQYVVGASAHLEQLLRGGSRHLVSRTAGWISPVILVDGRISGVWAYRRKGTRWIVELSPFGVLSATTRRGIEAEARAIAAFVGVDVEVSL